MKTSIHNLSHEVDFTCNQGEMIPCGLIEVLPGDNIAHATSALIRTQPLLAPIMHKVDVKVHHWFVPTRIIWEDWEKFITGGQDGLDASVAPTISLGSTAAGSLANYLGVPVHGTAQSVSALPFRAYATIYNEHYRDKDLQSALVVSKASGVDSTTSTALQNGCWEKDYFTSSRPTAQKGPSVSLPLSGDAPVRGFYTATTGATISPASNLSVGNSSPDSASMTAYSSIWMASKSAVGTPPSTAFNESNSNIFADLSNATAATVEQLRLALSIQRFVENMSRWGSTYSERLLAGFGIQPQDGRLNDPEYLGGGSQTIQFSEVLQTGVDSSDEGVGNMAGHGIAAMRSNKYRKFFPEHGYVLSIMLVRPKTQYVQGLHKLWSRGTKYDYFQPELQNLGQQAIYNRELKIDHATPAGVFGFQDRYDEYRRVENRVAGDFAGTLDFWHMARKFATDPALNSSFVTSNPTDRIYQVPAADQLLVMSKHHITARRLVSRIANPSIL